VQSYVIEAGLPMSLRVLIMMVCVLACRNASCCLHAQAYPGVPCTAAQWLEGGPSSLWHDSKFDCLL
jgi:hypothetical protein